MNDILKNYSLEITKIDKIKESTDGNVYLLKGNNKYILKIYEDLNHVESMCKLHSFLKDKMNIPTIILTKNNKEYMRMDSKRYGVIYSFLEGKKVSLIWNCSKEDLSRILAKELRKFHELTKGENRFQLKEVPFQVPNLKRKSALHFDLTKENVLINNSLIEIIDFDDAKYGPSVVDVAIICSFFYISKANGLDQEGMNIFLNEYYKEKDIEEKKYIKEIALEWIKYIRGNYYFDSSTTESFKNKQEIIENSLNI